MSGMGVGIGGTGDGHARGVGGDVRCVSCVEWVISVSVARTGMGVTGITGGMGGGVSEISAGELETRNCSEIGRVAQTDIRT